MIRCFKIIILPITIFLLSIFICAASADTEGTCGDGLTWTLDENGLLIINGSGEMTSNPWTMSEIKDVIISEGVTSLCKNAFYNAANIKSTSLPDSLISIGEQAFAGCTNLRGIELPEGLEIIGKFAFSRCAMITSIIIPENVTTIHNGAFSRCTGISTITIPDCITVLEGNTFNGCSNLKSITLSTNLTSIGSWDFGDCSSLTSIVIPDMVEAIGYQAFINCSNLRTIKLGDNLTSIGDDAFYQCTSLSNITIPENVTSLGPAFHGCTQLQSIEILGLITEIKNATFYDCTSLENISLPETLTKIGMSAFRNCIVKKVYFSGTEDQWNAITMDIYNDCLKSAKKTFGKGTCGLTGNLTWTLNKSGLLTISGIGDMEITAPKWDSFRASIHDVIIEEGITSLGYKSFSGCENLSSIKIPSTLATFNSSALTYCTGLEYINIAPGNEYFITEDRMIFDKNKSTLLLCAASKSSVTLPYGIKTIGSSAFEGCAYLTSIALPESVTNIGSSAFYKCTNLQHIMVPNSVTEIGNSAFSYCTSLIDFIIPTNLTTISMYTFEYCSGLKSITIHKDVTIIGGDAFYSCDSLNTVYYEGTEEEWNAIRIREPDDGNYDITSANKYYNFSIEREHNWSAPVYTFADDMSSVTATRICSYNDQHIETETVLIETTDIPPTCEAAGYISYDAIFTNPAFEAQCWQEVYGEPLGHSWTEPVYEWNFETRTLTAQRNCEHDSSHIETEAVDIHYNIMLSPTELENGEYNWVSDSFLNPAFSIQTKENCSIPALNALDLLQLPNSVRVIEAEAFDSITAEAVIINQNCERIEAQAFANCSNLIYAFVPENVELNDDAFSGCSLVIIDRK